MLKAYKIRLCPTFKQKNVIEQTIGNCRFIFNQMLNEKISVYEKLKDDKEKLYSHKYKTEKEYKQEFEFLKLGSSRALQQSRGNLDTAFQNFYRNLKQGKKVGFPKFKKKSKSNWSYREPAVGKSLRIENNKLVLLKVGKVKFRGLSKKFTGEIKNATVTKNKDNTFSASILVEQPQVRKLRTDNKVIGLDLGLKEFAITSDSVFYSGIKEKLYGIEKKIKRMQKHFSRKVKGSRRREKTRIKIAKLYQYKTNIQNHFFWHLANKLCRESQTIAIENLNIKGMVRNHKLARAISYASWGKFILFLKQKANEYYTEIFEISTFFPSSKLCSNCGNINSYLKLLDRMYICECGYEEDRDVNAGKNIRNYFLKNKSLEYDDYKHGEIVRPTRLTFDFVADFNEVFTDGEKCA